MPSKETNAMVGRGKMTEDELKNKEKNIIENECDQQEDKEAEGARRSQGIEQKEISQKGA